MSIARTTIINQVNNGSKAPRVNLDNLRAGMVGHIVGELNFGAFNATTNPNGIQSLGASDTIIAAVSNRAGAQPARNNTSGKNILKSIRVYTNAAITLGTGNNLTVKIIRSSNSDLADVVVGTVPESAGLGTAGALIEVIENVGVILEDDDQVVLVPDGDLDGSADATDKIFVEISFKRLVHGGRLDQGLAAA